jgi:hypothetical protein
MSPHPAGTPLLAADPPATADPPKGQRAGVSPVSIVYREFGQPEIV